MVTPCPPPIVKYLIKYRFLKLLFRSFKSLLLAMADAEVQESSVSADTPFDPTKPSVPISYPIKKLEDLLSRSYFESFHYPFNKASAPLPPFSLPPRPRMLVCHDMAGGYLDDKWVQGGTNPDAYAIWHWYLIDVFVYFSHNLVTIPPPCWTNAAHLHGVKVLGTFITEWDEGRAVCDVLLATKESAQLYAQRLTELAVSLGFDGWLLNMEVNLHSAQIPNLKEFVSHLTETMHSSMPGSLVIWYDSVTKDGNLSWQNQLNEYNKPFFDLCDGIFANYSWEEDYPKNSASVAGDRKFDVYMGIDVFGRNTYGGGQWKTNVALEVLKKDDVSAAIFAPGWVYETKQPPDFQTAQNRWWGQVEQSWGIMQSYPKVLPFYTNFDQGHGLHLFFEGMPVSHSVWNNISSQPFQPVLDGSSDPAQSPIQASITFKDASYCGGACILFKGTVEIDSPVTKRLFQGEIPLKDQSLYITFSVKLSGSSMLGLSLGFSKLSERTVVLLAPRQTFLHAERISAKFDTILATNEIKDSNRGVQDPTGWTLQLMSIKMKDYTLTDINAVCYSEKNLHLESHLSGLDLKTNSSSLTTTALEYTAYLGDISIRTSGENMVFPPPAFWEVTGQYVSWGSDPEGAKTVSLKIDWKLKGGGDASLFPKYNIFARKEGQQVNDTGPGNVFATGEEYVGFVKAKAFYVSDLVVPKGVSDLVFIIQVCGVDGSSQKLDQSPILHLSVSG